MTPIAAGPISLRELRNLSIVQRGWVEGREFKRSVRSFVSVSRQPGGIT